MMRINYVIARLELKTFKLQNGVQFQMELFDRFSMSVDSIQVVQAVQFKKISGKHYSFPKRNNCSFIYFLLTIYHVTSFC